MSATLDALLEPLSLWLNDQSVEEICCQKPCEIWVFKDGKYERHSVPELDSMHVEDVAIVAAAQRRMDIWRNLPPVDTDLSGRGRINAILPPCVPEGMPCITIRRGGDYWPTFEEQRKRGTFKRAKAKRDTEYDQQLIALYRAALDAKDENERGLLWEKFFTRCVALGMTIFGAGITASGKTTFLRSCVRANPNKHKRIITVADTPEMVGLEGLFPNSVQLFYDRNETRVGMRAEDMIVAALRMRPEELIVQEVRDGPAGVALVDGLMSGHKGKSTIHARSCAQAFERLKFIYKKTTSGAAVNDTDLITQLRDLIDVIVHFSDRTDGSPVAIDEVWFSAVDDGV